MTRRGRRLRPAAVVATALGVVAALGACGPSHRSALPSSAGSATGSTTGSTAGSTAGSTSTVVPSSVPPTSTSSGPAPPPPATPAPSTPPATSPTSPTSPTAAVDPAALARFYAERVAWGSCPTSWQPIDHTSLGALQCATLTVPLDYAHPGGRTLTLGLARARATGGPRIGSLLLNFGGPGEAGLRYLPGYATSLPAEVRARFDLVSFDPRGVGVSAGLHCLTGPQLDALYAASPPTTAGQQRAWQAQLRTLAEGCRASAGGELPYVGTVEAARDLDLIRSAVGDARTSYVGFSYGSELGAVYAQLFPRRVRALVLDGAVPPGLDPRTQLLQQAVSLDRELTDFLGWCGTGRCPFPGGTIGARRREVQSLLAHVAAHPLPTGSGRDLQGGTALSGLAWGLYFTSTWPSLATALTDAAHGDGAGLLALADQVNGRASDGSYDSISSAFPAIECADQPAQFTLAQAAGYAKAWARQAPVFGPPQAWELLQCDGWPRSAAPVPTAVKATGAPPIVVLGNTGDPATPYQWAQQLAAELISARLVTFVGDGHTVWGSGRSSCVDQAVDRYLIDGTPPAAGLRCG